MCLELQRTATIGIIKWCPGGHFEFAEGGGGLSGQSE